VAYSAGSHFAAGDEPVDHVAATFANPAIFGESCDNPAFVEYIDGTDSNVPAGSFIIPASETMLLLMTRRLHWAGNHSHAAENRVGSLKARVIVFSISRYHWPPRSKGPDQFRILGLCSGSSSSESPSSNTRPRCAYLSISYKAKRPPRLRYFCGRGVAERADPTTNSCVGHVKVT